MTKTIKIKSSNLVFTDEIKRLITAARNSVVKSIDHVQVYTCFEIGRRIVEQEQKGSARAEYGKQLIADLSASLTIEFGSGFSERNLRNMRKFYLLYQDRFNQIWQMTSAKLGQNFPKLADSPVFQLSWSQYVFLIGIKDDDARSFYEIESADNQWTLPELSRQFNYSGEDIIGLFTATEEHIKQGKLLYKIKKKIKIFFGRKE